jgi:sec-independent protein translocase protein TatA
MKREGVFMNLGIGEILLILAVVLLLFGAKRIPDLAKSLGNGVREFRKGLSGELDEKDKDKDKPGDKQA